MLSSCGLSMTMTMTMPTIQHNLIPWEITRAELIAMLGQENDLLTIPSESGIQSRQRDPYFQGVIRCFSGSVRAFSPISNNLLTRNENKVGAVERAGPTKLEFGEREWRRPKFGGRTEIDREGPRDGIQGPGITASLVSPVVRSRVSIAAG